MTQKFWLLLLRVPRWMSWLCFLNHTLRSCLTCALKNLQKQLINAPAILHVTGNLKTGKTLQLGQELNLKGEKAMDGFVKTLGVLMVLAAVALWAALIFFVPAALIKFLWQTQKRCKKVLTEGWGCGIILERQGPPERMTSESGRSKAKEPIWIR